MRISIQALGQLQSHASLHRPDVSQQPDYPSPTHNVAPGSRSMYDILISRQEAVLMLGR
jgi:hypothetical protein